MRITKEQIEKAAKALAIQDGQADDWENDASPFKAKVGNEYRGLARAAAIAFGLEVEDE